MKNDGNSHPIKPSSIIEPSDWLTHNDQTPAGEREHPQNIQAFRESNDVKRFFSAQAQQGTDCGWIWITLDLSYIFIYDMYILQCVHIYIFIYLYISVCVSVRAYILGYPPFSRATIADPWPLTVPSLQWATSKQLVAVGFHPCVHLGYRMIWVLTRPYVTRCKTRIQDA